MNAYENPEKAANRVILAGLALFVLLSASLSLCGCGELEESYTDAEVLMPRNVPENPASYPATVQMPNAGEYVNDADFESTTIKPLVDRTAHLKDEKLDKTGDQTLDGNLVVKALVADSVQLSDHVITTRVFTWADALISCGADAELIDWYPSPPNPVAPTIILQSGTGTARVSIPVRLPDTSYVQLTNSTLSADSTADVEIRFKQVSASGVVTTLATQTFTATLSRGTPVQLFPTQPTGGLSDVYGYLIEISVSGSTSEIFSLAAIKLEFGYDRFTP